MENKFGTLYGIDVYKVKSFDEDLKNQGFIQLEEWNDRYLRLFTTHNDGTYDSWTGEVSIYDDRKFQEHIKVLKILAAKYNKPVSLRVKVEETTFNFEEDMCMKNITDIINEIMGKAENTCEKLKEVIHTEEAVG